MKQSYCKRMAAVVMLLACSICGNAKIEFLEDYKDMDGVSYSYISKYALDNMDLGAISFPSQDFSKMKGKISSLQSLSSVSSASAKILADVETFVKKEKYELVVMQNVSKKVSKQVFFREQSGSSSMLIVSSARDVLTIIALEGTFTLADFMNKNGFFYQ
ncbi:MAG: DUF4252 domain-containing protein [Bacteroidaceae bacterium]|nr:DUF4252 domain-containing protein [Bacteroidaceae bacterium]